MSSVTADAAASGPVEAALRERIRVAIGEAAALLSGPGQPAPGADPAHRLGPLIDALEQRLETTAVAATITSEQAAHRATLDRLRLRFENRTAAMERIDEAVARLRHLTAPAAMLAAAAEALVTDSHLDRVILSLVSGGTIRAHAVHVRDDPDRARAMLEALRALAIHVDHSLVESEVLRRRRATVVTEARVHPRVHRPTAELMGWVAYVAAPVVVDKRVIALLQADRMGAPVDARDRDLLWEFANGLAQAYDSANLRRTLRGEREQLRDFLRWLDARSSELNHAGILFSPRERSLPEPPHPLRDGAGPGARDERGALGGLVTRRELDVLRLLADGHSNRAIAAELVLSLGTVKFHVNSILRKLHAANRAQAVSRYLALTRVPEA